MSPKGRMSLEVAERRTIYNRAARKLSDTLLSIEKEYDLTIAEMALLLSNASDERVDEVVAEVDTLGKFYFNVDDSVFGHPQLADRPHENQYYLDLYGELAKLRPHRSWGGAGGLAAVNYKDGRRILELATGSIW